MTPPPEFSEPRRSFVKKSLATTVSISFAGLIRASGEEGGGTTTTWSPDQTTISSTDGGTTNTWDPDQTTLATTETTQLPEPALYKLDANGTLPQSGISGVLGAFEVVEDKGGGQFNTRWIGKAYWTIEADMEVPPPEKVNGQPVKKTAECFACEIKNVKVTLAVVNANEVRDALAGRLEVALNKQLGLLFNGNPNLPYMPSPGLMHGVSGTALLGPMNFPEICTDNPAAISSPANNQIRFMLTPEVTPPEDNHSKFISWECRVIGAAALTAAQLASLLSAAQAAVIEHNPQWQIIPPGTFSLQAPAFPQIAWERGQEGFAVWAVNPEPGSVCDIP